MQVAFLIIVGVIFIGVALIAVWAPKVLFEPLGIEWAGTAGPAELRAAYFGLMGAGGWLCRVGVVDASQRQLALTFLQRALAGFVIGRLVSWALDGMPDHPLALVALGVETLGLGCTLALRGPRSSG